jgi:hypothetical protein
MEYFEPIDHTIDNVVFQNWSLVARDDEDYEEKKLRENPRVIPKDKIPKFRFDISIQYVDELGNFKDRDPKDFEVAKRLAVEKRKERELYDLDFEAKVKIKEGFSFDNNSFSLSSNAQLNWQNIMSMKQMGLFQNLEISTKDNQPYLLTEDKVVLFIKAYYNTLNAILADNRKKKQDIINTSIEDYIKGKKESEFNTLPF